MYNVAPVHSAITQRRCHYTFMNKAITQSHDATMADTNQMIPAIVTPQRAPGWSNWQWRGRWRDGMSNSFRVCTLRLVPTEPVIWSYRSLQKSSVTTPVHFFFIETLRRCRTLFIPIRDKTTLQMSLQKIMSSDLKQVNAIFQRVACSMEFVILSL